MEQIGLLTTLVELGIVIVCMLIGWSAVTISNYVISLGKNDLSSEGNDFIVYLSSYFATFWVGILIAMVARV